MACNMNSVKDTSVFLCLNSTICLNYNIRLICLAVWLHAHSKVAVVVFKALVSFVASSLVALCQHYLMDGFTMDSILAQRW